MPPPIPDRPNPDVKEILKPSWRPLDRGVAVPIVGDTDNHQLFRVGRRGGRLELWMEPDNNGSPQIHVRTRNAIFSTPENDFILPSDRNFIGRGDWSFLGGHDKTIGHHQFTILKDETSGGFFLTRMSVGHATELTKISEKVPPPVHAFGATSRGRQRPNNEDALFVHPAGGVYLVCDGVGGEKRGEIASRAAVQTAGSLLGKKRNIPLAVSDANAEIITNGQGAATTIVGAVETSPNHFDVFNLGDSRAYRINRQTGKMDLLTRDHVEIQTSRKIVTRALGHNASDLYRTNISLQEDEFLLLCTDGFSDYVDKGDITSDQIKFILNNQPINTAAKSLIALANRAGGKDNITAVIIGHRR